MTWSDRRREKREARLLDIRQQVCSGALVISQMTAAEHADRAREREKRHALMTPAERTRIERVLHERRRRAALLDDQDRDSEAGEEASARELPRDGRVASRRHPS